MIFFAGLLSGLLGVGGGVLKVLGMDTMMRLPFKVSTTTSNFMIGVTATASTGILYVSGYVNVLLAAPVALGVVVGSLVGAKVLTALETSVAPRPLHPGHVSLRRRDDTHGDLPLNPEEQDVGLNDAIGKVLRYGVVLSSVVLAAGLALMLLAPPPGAPESLQGTIAANFGGPTLSPIGAC